MKNQGYWAAIERRMRSRRARWSQVRGLWIFPSGATYSGQWLPADYDDSPSGNAYEVALAEDPTVPKDDEWEQLGREGQP